MSCQKQVKLLFNIYLQSGSCLLLRQRGIVRPEQRPSLLATFRGFRIKTNLSRATEKQAFLARKICAESWLWWLSNEATVAACRSRSSFGAAFD